MSGPIPTVVKHWRPVPRIGKLVAIPSSVGVLVAIPISLGVAVAIPISVGVSVAVPISIGAPAVPVAAVPISRVAIAGDSVWLAPSSEGRWGGLGDDMAEVRRATGRGREGGAPEVVAESPGRKV